MTGEQAMALLDRCELLTECGRSREAVRWLPRACAMGHALRDRRIVARALYLYAAHQPVDDAVPSLLAALELAEALRWPDLRWRIHWEMGRKGRDAGAVWLERDGYLEAYRILERMASRLDAPRRQEFWSLPARRVFVREWQDAPVAFTEPPDWNYLIRQRVESREALPSWCR